MKFARVIAGIFAVVGLVLMLGTVGISLYGLNHPTLAVEIPQEAADCSEQLAQALSGGDLAAAAQLLDGQPALGVDSVPSDPMAARFWDAFRESMSCQLSGECYVLDGGFARDAVITALDVEAMTRDFQTRSHDLMNQRVEAATEMAELYDENNNFRQDLIDQVLEQACQEALDQARDRGLTLPIVCNTSSYETVETVELLARHVTVWLADIKYISSRLSGEYSAAPDYFEVAEKAIGRMLQLAGPPVFGPDGILQRGVILRHLSLPGALADSKAVLEWMAALPAGSFIPSLMSQYTPFYKAAEHKALGRRISSWEYRQVVNTAVDLGLCQGYMQEKSSAKEEYTPAFDLTGVPESYCE